MVADFSEAGCLFVEDLFLEFLIDADNGIDRSDDKLVATFDDECGHELVFILSQEEVHYVIHAISEKLDNIVLRNECLLIIRGGESNDLKKCKY